MTLTLPHSFDAIYVQQLKEMLTKGQTSLSLLFAENGKQLCLQTKQKVNLDADLLQKMEKENIKVHITI